MTSGVELLEQAVFLCRANRNGAMAAYWIGTAPFVTAVFYFCQTVTTRATAGEQLIPLSFVLAILWMWMNFWHTVFCDGLWRSVANEPEGGWSPRIAARAVMTNAALQGPGMFILGIAAVMSLPFPWAHAFFQNCHVYAARFDLPETSRLATQQAALWPKQNWQLLSCVMFLGFLLFLNAMLAIYLGAQLLHSLFGVQTALVRSQTAILGLPYLATSACITFIALDPFWKAAHVIRCFHGESKRSGADLRLLLRRISILAAIALMSLEAQAQTVEAQKYERAIQEVLQRPEYEWSGRRPIARSASDSALARNAEAIRVWVGRALQRLVEWLRKLSPEAQSPRPGAPPGPGLRWTVMAAFALCLMGVGLYLVRSRARRKPAVSIADNVPAAVAVDITDEALMPDELPANEWLQLADGYLRHGDTRLAARAVYLAALSQLDTEKLITIGRHKTNLEYERELARRGRGMPSVSSAFRNIASTFERTWYGLHAVDESEVRELRTSLTTLRVHA